MRCHQDFQTCPTGSLWDITFQKNGLEMFYQQNHLSVVGGDATQGKEQLQEEEKGSSYGSVRQAWKGLEVVEDPVWN